VDSSITNLKAFAAHIGCSPWTIKLFNPWLLKDVLHNPGKKVYEIRVPKGGGDYSGYASDLMAETGNLIGYVKNPSAIETMSADSVALLGTKTIYHVVRVEEPLKDLAKFFKVSEEDLKRWNNLTDEEMAVEGQTLIIHYNKDQGSQ
jgi:hypothetical protein